MIRFSLFGIPVEIQPWFWLTMGLIGSINGGNDPEGLLMIGLFMIAGFVSILVHELGHALTGRAFGAPTAIVLHAFGGFAVFPSARFTRWQDILVTAAGPAVQIALGGLAFLVLTRVELPNIQIERLFFFLMSISIFWAILNLIPVIPLDGGRLMASFLGPRRGALALQISLVAAIVAAGLLLMFTRSIIFPVFLVAMAYQNWREFQHYR